MSLFAKAKAKTADKPVVKKGTRWLANTDDTQAVSHAVSEMVKLSAEQKATEAKISLHKDTVKGYAFDKFIQQFAGDGVLPPTPMTVQNSAGHSVTYVVQDRGGQYKVTEEQQEALGDILGPDAVKGLLYEETTYSFSRVLLMNPDVMDAIDKALESAKNKLVRAGTLSEEEASELIVAESKTSFRPGTLERLATICGQDTVKMSAFLDAAGSSFTRYVKV